MNIFSSQNLARERIAICESCNHFRKKTRTCGTPIKGNKVQYKKKYYRLCGCFMDVKTAIQFAKCPLGKWEGLQLTHEEYLEIKELLDNTKVRITNIQQQHLRNLSEKYLGIRIRTSGNNCTPCVKKNLKRLERIVEEYEK